MRNESSPNRRTYDIIIFGATGFTGKWLVHEVLKTTDTTCEDNHDGIKFTWAIAGRSFKSMEQLLLQIGRETRKELRGKVDMIQADLSHPSSIVSMVQQCKVVLNCVGPYQKYGECVVKACAEYGTHHLDLSGEPYFLAQMELRYSRTAERSAAYIIGACGFDSIPVDCGALHLQQHFTGEVNSIESFVEFGSESSKMSIIHSGTWKSAVWAAHYALNTILVKGDLNKNYNPPKPKYKLPFWPIQYRKEVNSWCVFIPAPDGEVLERSQRYLTQNENLRRKPFQTKCYLQLPSLLHIAFFLLCTLVYSTIAQLKWGAKILEKYPRLFTFGMSSDEGPKEEDMNQTKFTFTLVAKGWSENSTSHDNPPNKTKILRVKGKNPGYGGTVKIFLQSALTILAEKEKMPKYGGVYSPGIAFLETNLVERINRSGVSFTLEN